MCAQNDIILYHFKIDENLCNEKNFVVTVAKFNCDNEKVIIIGLYLVPSGNMDLFLCHFDLCVQKLCLRVLKLLSVVTLT